MWLSKSEWRRHVRELARERKRADKAERYFYEMVNRLLTKNGSAGIAAPADVAAQGPPPVVLPKPVLVGGVTEEEFIDDALQAGLDKATAQARWKQAKEYGLLPYQLEGELPS